MSIVPMRVALAVHAASAHGRGLIVGVAEYARLNGPWSFFPEPAFDHESPQFIRDAQCTGIIAHVRDEAMAESLRQTGLPVVAVNDHAAWGNRPTVCLDEEAIGRLAARHLLDRGLREFAFLGEESAGERRESELCGRAFAELIEAAGFPVHAYHAPPHTARHWLEQSRALADWLGRLRRPVGVFAASDQLAWRAIEAARHASRRVPEDLAILGVDDDPIYGAMSVPPLSSVKTPSRQLGFEAAALLERLQQGETPPDEPLRLAPIQVVERQSSDVLAVADAELAAALRFIREHADRPLQVADVLEAVPLSRRSLERRFREHFGRTPSSEIQRVQLERAKALLVDTDLPMPQVAARSGLGNADRLAAVFRRETGMPPSEFRDRYRME